jgi:adenosylmethionine-8-amino-7-oxononanoate aminotransferase
MKKGIEFLRHGLSKIGELSIVGDIRQRGYMIGIELVKNRGTKEPFPLKEKIAWKVCNKARDKGLLIRPLGNVIVLMPTLNMSGKELKSLLRITAEAISEVTQ